ncbi:AAA family ATPase [Paraburkholderia bonniea]|uniref:AAA family ATPase n=1 Tax=Paraburkholderia bonniea TaxID=2152891 RepID=UPI003306933F
MLAELGRRGYAVVPEPGRRIVQTALHSNGTALPWVDPVAFLRRAIDVALADRASLGSPCNWTFFDRGVIDAAAGLQHLTGEPVLTQLGPRHRYHQRVFLTPPWPQIYVQDAERQHSLEHAMDEYSRLLEVWPALGYEVSIVPRLGVMERADFVLKMLGN